MSDKRVIKRLRAELLRLAERRHQAQNENERLRTTVNDQAATITKLFEEVERMLHDAGDTSDRDI